MNMIIYISDERPDLLDNVFNDLYISIEKLQHRQLKKLIVGSATNFSHASHFVVDLSSLDDDIDEVVDGINSFLAMYDEAKIIVIADKEEENSVLLSRLVDNGIYNIVSSLEDDQLKKCLHLGKTKGEALEFQIEKPDLTKKREEKNNVKIDKQEQKEIVKTTPIVTEKITANKIFKKHKPYINVAVCGTEKHIGSTHQALLIAKFLSNIGFKVCYLDANEVKKIQYIANVYSVNANEQKKMLQFEGVDMYFDFELPALREIGYEFYVFDFGDFTSFVDVKKWSYFTQDIKIIVSGTKAWEMPSLKSTFDGITSHANNNLDINFIMNFTPINETEKIKQLMGGFKSQTFFSDFNPYPFEKDVNLEIYKKIFGNYISIEKSETSQEPQQKVKRKFFGSWG